MTILQTIPPAQLAVIIACIAVLVASAFGLGFTYRGLLELSRRERDFRAGVNVLRFAGRGADEAISRQAN